MKRSYVLAAALAALLVPSAGQAASEEPFWQQAPIAGATAKMPVSMRLSTIDADDRMVGRAGSKAGFEQQDAAGLVMQWTQNVWLTATGGFNETGTAVSGEVKLHLGF